ncbi:amidase domain-containing protein [Halalkalibacterium halodurans]|uniref:Putative amidase domain-containing protein n=1 Tax=Halalkalibacterium halodurans TaxID=86665 RepID=A0A0M0KMV0_ALKHA|nr:amidase domain-containing protein [Halalkalibacterium halodurans]MED4163082.1 amidase domain-containing protein [Halalkalibacterium halodurans]TPE70625.1 amidase domain-containing protein [Halalkalibacterium halodurans]
MSRNALQQLHSLIEKRNEGFVNGKVDFLCHEDDLLSLERRRQRDKNRGAETVKANVNGAIVSRRQIDEKLIVDYSIKYEFLIRMNKRFYIEEQQQERRAIFLDDGLLEDREIPVIEEEYDHSDTQTVFLTSPVAQRSSYDRREAIRYAERWWNDYNPNYKNFENNCTNFISQCLRAGGAPTTGAPNRSKGWWYQNNNWSYSWTVANAMRWHLSGARTGLRGEERKSPRDLIPGDVICYDFNGDGRWQHTTIVVAKDVNGDPLVNAQTTNSRMRYWAYEDSTAYTPNIQYKFFHIVDRF